MIITSLLGEIKRKEKILDKDEILAKSREEYKKNNKDEMMLDIMSKAGKLSMEVGKVFSLIRSTFQCGQYIMRF